jgi:hypothetical protein
MTFQGPALTRQNKVIVGWTQAICDDCWLTYYFVRDTPVRMTESEREQCCMCGMPTTSGIYIREDPMLVRYPRPKDRYLLGEWNPEAEDVVLTEPDSATPAADL